MIKGLLLVLFCCGLFSGVRQVLAAPNENTATTETEVQTPLVWVITYPVVTEVQTRLIGPVEPTEKVLVHTVVGGDTLSQLSLDYLGAAERYPEIAHDNEIPNPDLIFVGQEVKITTLEAVEEFTTEQTIQMQTLVLPVTTQPVQSNVTATEIDTVPASAFSESVVNTKSPMTFTATGYSCSLAEETAHWENGTLTCNHTASGIEPSWGTIAVDPKQIPMGTKVALSNFPGVVFTAQDTGGAIKENRIDVWFPSYEQAINFGRQNVLVTILDDGKLLQQTVSIPSSQEGWQWPVTGPLSDYFGTCDPHLRGVNCEFPHTGIDIDLFGNGHVDVKAAKSGTAQATFCDNSDGYGCRVILNHQNGFQTMYAHLSSIAVSQGQRVKQGESLGISGTTGFTTGEHLHFEIRKEDVPLNPLNYLP